MNCVVREKVCLGNIENLLTQFYPTVANKVPSRVPYKAVANLYPNLAHPSGEKYCVIITMKIRNSDSVVDHCVFSLTFE